MLYPEKILRGISDSNYIDANGHVSAAAFQFNPNIERTDGFEEASINWYDDENALKLLLNKKKENSDSNQFKGGVAILSRQFIDIFVNGPAKNELSYERQPIADNSYHGNLLRIIAASKQRKSTISATIAMSVEKVIPVPDVKL